jgi:hypothetical protein
MDKFYSMIYIRASYHPLKETSKGCCKSCDFVLRYLI